MVQPISEVHCTNCTEDPTELLCPHNRRSLLWKKSSPISAFQRPNLNKRLFNCFFFLYSFYDIVFNTLSRGYFYMLLKEGELESRHFSNFLLFKTLLWISIKQEVDVLESVGTLHCNLDKHKWSRGIWTLQISAQCLFTYPAACGDNVPSGRPTLALWSRRCPTPECCCAAPSRWSATGVQSACGHKHLERQSSHRQLPSPASIPGQRAGSGGVHLFLRPTLWWTCPTSRWPQTLHQTATRQSTGENQSFIVSYQIVFVCRSFY